MAGSLRRKTPIKRRKRLSTSKRPLTVAERAVYQSATERARDPLGYLECEGCGRGIIDGGEHRHHIRQRSRGGETTVDNISVLCLNCHGLAHGLRTNASDSVSPGPVIE